MAITKFTHQKDESFDETQRLMCSVHGCPNRWSIHSDGDKPKCSKHQWQRSEKKPAVQSWHEVGEEF